MALTHTNSQTKSSYEFYTKGKRLKPTVYFLSAHWQGLKLDDIQLLFILLYQALLFAVV